MKKLTSILAAAITLAACGQSEDPAAEYRDAMPQAQSVQVQTAAAEGGSAPTALTRSNALIANPGYQSDYAIISYWTAVTINGGTGWTLGLLHLVMSFDPTDCDSNSCTWGPWLGDDRLNSWKLVATKGDGAFQWAFSGQNAVAPGPWVTLISGTAHPGADKNHNYGSFLIDFDAQDALAHGPGWQKDDFGTLEISYDSTSGLHVNAVALGSRNDDPNDPHFMNAVYSFAKTGPGGELQIAVENLDTAERLWLRTRWDATGSGRGDLEFDANGGDRADSFFASECWDGPAANWAMDFDTDPALNDASYCPSAMQSAVYGDLSLP
jgi:hypothetical protein